MPGRSDIVRVFNLDNNPKGPGIKVKVMPSPSNGVHTGTHYDLPLGSYLDVPSSRAVQLSPSFTITTWIAPPTIPGTDYNQLATARSPAFAPRAQGIVSLGSTTSTSSHRASLSPFTSTPVGCSRSRCVRA